MCGPSSGQKAAATQQSNFTNLMQSQASTVFGADNQLFNSLFSAYNNIVNQGPNQQGFSQAELNSMNSQAITNNANQYRNVAGAVKAGQAGYGGGNNVSTAGSTIGANQSVAEAAAANTANQLAGITQANYATGRQNFFQAAGSEGNLANQAYGNVGNVAGATQGALNANSQAQTQLNNENNWWVQPVMGLANAGLSMATGGLSTVAQNALGGGSAAIGGQWNGGQVGGVSDQALNSPSYMPGGGPEVSAPIIGTVNSGAPQF
jgi:hypothetical protein